MKALIINILIDKLVKEGIVPLTNYLIHSVKKVFKKLTTRQKLKKLEKAKKENDETNYNNTIDSL